MVTHEDDISHSTPDMPDADLVLVIDDEPQIRRAVRDALRDVTSRVDEAANGVAGVDAATTGRPDLVVLDLGLPDMAGVDVCREIRQRSAVPIIVLSARHSEHEKVDLLNAGADDYVTKPFSVLELAARAKAQIRRAKTLAAATANAAPVTVGGLVDRHDRAQGVARRGAAAPHADRVADSGDTPRGRGPNADAPADLRRGVGAAVRQSAAILARAHHQSSAEDRGRSGCPATHHHRAGRRLSSGIGALTVAIRRDLVPWIVWIAMMAVVTVVLVQVRDTIDQVHVVLVYLLVVLGASTSGGRLLAFPLACVSASC